MSQTPDLSALDPALRRRIDVAVARGYEWWRRDENDAWRLARLGESVPINEAVNGALVLRADGEVLDFGLPDPENDPAAAWELATSELSGLRQAGSGRGWFGTWWDVDRGPHGGQVERQGPLSDTPGRAVVLAFLAKHRQTAGG